MKCYECFREYWEGNVCPHCGYQSEYSDTEVRCLEKGTFICDGRYEIGRVIGAGGFGVTYAAWDTMLQMRVAIKEYLPGEFSTRAPGNISVSIYGGEKEEQYKDGLAKFYEESQRLAQFQEVQGIVQVFDVFMENETAYIVMEYLEGETLAERLKREEKIPYQEAVKIILPILQALEAVHKEGILHRDIAANNIFLCKNGEVKLFDFGAARSATGTHSKSLTVLYKEGYTAEEQYRSRGDQGPWTDVYACAATLYKMLTGKIPQGAMERRRKDMLKAPSKCGVKVPINIDRAVMNALNLEIGNRTQTVRQLMDELVSLKGVKDHFKKVKNKKRDLVPLWIWVISAVTVICVGFFMYFVIDERFEFVDGFANLFVEEGKVRVPNIKNMSKEEAKKRLEKLNLYLEVEEFEFNSLIEEGIILKQSEEKGKLVDSGAVIHVTISEGYEKIVVPNLADLSLDEATKKLDELSLSLVVEKYEFNSLIEEGIILKQSEEKGKLVDLGAVIHVTVSEGYGKVVVPDFSGVDMETAEILAEEQQLIISSFSFVVGPENSVVSQNLEAGSVVERDSSIILDIGFGYPEELAKELLRYVNEYRVAAGVSSLTWDSGLEKKAQAFAQWDATGQGNIYAVEVDPPKVMLSKCDGNNPILPVADWVLRSVNWPSETSFMEPDIYNPNYSTMGGALYFLPNAELEYCWAICIQ